MKNYKILNTRYCILSTILALGILFIYRGTVFAAPEAMQITPALEEITLTPETPSSYQLTITNTSDRPLGIHADVSNFQSADEEDSFTSSPLLSWTDVSPTDLIIPSSEKKTITVTISPPQNIKKGGYYAAIVLTPFISKTHAPKTPIILSRITTLVLAQYGAIDYTNLKEKAQVSDFSFARPAFEKIPFDFHFSVKNAYFTHFSAKPFLTITPLFGNSQRIPLSEKHILPGKSKVWHEEVSPQAFSFFYKAHLAVSVGAGNYITADSFIIVIPYLHYILSGIILLFLLLFATYHKRARKALAILFTGRS